MLSKKRLSLPNFRILVNKRENTFVRLFISSEIPFLQCFHCLCSLEFSYSPNFVFKIVQFHSWIVTATFFSHFISFSVSLTSHRLFKPLRYFPMSISRTARAFFLFLSCSFSHRRNRSFYSENRFSFAAKWVCPKFHESPASFIFPDIGFLKSRIFSLFFS